MKKNILYNKYPWHFNFLMADLNIMNTRELILLRRRVGDGGFTLYFLLAVMFANYDGCLAYVESDMNGDNLVGYELGAVGNTFVVDDLLMERIVATGIPVENAKRYLAAMLDPSIHLLYKREDGIWAITGLTSDVNGPKLHIDSYLVPPANEKEKNYSPLFIKGISQSRDLALPAPQPFNELGDPDYHQNPPVLDGTGVSIKTLASVMNVKQNTLSIWIKRNDLGKYFFRATTDKKLKLLPFAMQEDFVECYQKKISLEYLKIKWDEILHNYAENQLLDEYVTGYVTKTDEYVTGYVTKTDRYVTEYVTNDTPCHILDNTENGINKQNNEYVTYVTKNVCDKMSHMSHNMSHTEMICDKDESVVNNDIGINKPNNERETYVTKNSSRIIEYKNNNNDDDDTSSIRESFCQQVQAGQIYKFTIPEYRYVIDDILDACILVQTCTSPSLRISSKETADTIRMKYTVANLNYDKLWNLVNRIIPMADSITDIRSYFLTIMNKQSGAQQSALKKSNSSKTVALPAYWSEKDNINTAIVDDEKLAELQKLQNELNSEYEKN